MSRASMPLADLWRKGRLGASDTETPEVVFSQVREDATVEVAALKECARPAEVFCIGSGGCTAFSLLTAQPRSVTALDINPAQIHLVALKRAALLHLDHATLLAAMNTDTRPAYPLLRAYLDPETQTFWDARQESLSSGLQQCGLIEQKLKRVMRLFQRLVVSRNDIETLFSQSDLAAQQAFYRKRWDIWRWRLALKIGLSRPALRRVYGPDFVAAVPDGFADWMRQQIEDALANFPAATNGHLWQTFLQRYPPDEAGLPLYLQQTHREAIQAGLSTMTLIAAETADWLEGQNAARFDFFALSNITEAISSEMAARLLRAVATTAKPGALVCMRSIFPPQAGTPVPLPERLEDDTALAARLARADRSFACKTLRILRAVP